MANATISTPVYANNITIITKLASCNSNFNVTQTVQELYDYYRGNVSTLVSSTFLNVSISAYDCVSFNAKYFQQVIYFINAVSIRVQVTLAAFYFDFVTNRHYIINGFDTGREIYFNLSSISLNNTAKADACATGETALDPLCSQNSSTPICYEPTSNPWIYNCSQHTTTSTTSTSSTTRLLTSTVSPLTDWQIGSICAAGLLFLLIIIGFAVWMYRRRPSVTRVANLHENYIREMKSEEKKGIPQGQSFQKTATVVQPRRPVQKPVPWVRQVNPGTNGIHQETVSNKKSTVVHPQTSVVNLSKLRGPTQTTQKKKISTSIMGTSKVAPSEPRNSPVPLPVSTVVVSRPVSGTSVDQLRSITDGLEEHRLEEIDSISLDRSSTPNQKKTSRPVSRQTINGSFIDESLRDEDAWMPILAVANEQLDALNGMEKLVDRTKV